jgi:hypothetical protein
MARFKTVPINPLAMKQTDSRLVPRKSIGKAKVITCRWVFATKRNEKGVIVRYKARLVIHGFK